jgi:Fe2+ or Zn2+ uptake regulation protein/O6-methylguanine-DNA--protein-cysteine methyltransferase
MNADAARALRERGLRVTPQRRAILAAFAGGPGEHLSAEEVHARAVAAVPGIGRGTVYATLAELADLGLIAAFGSPEPVRYETNVEPHQHFRCRQCLRLFDVDLPAPAPALAGFLVERVAVIAVGVCAECRDYERGLRAGAADLHERARVDATALACCRVDSPFGALVVAASDAGLVRVAFPDQADHAPLLARRRHGPRGARRRAAHAVSFLEAYLGGAPGAADDVVDWSAVPGRAALEAVALIPYGELRSYERLGVPGGVYDLGRTMGANPLPLVFPCHRVSCGSRIPDAYVGGPAARAWLDDFERPPVTPGPP